MHVYHVVTDRPMYVGQQIIFDEQHHSGVYRRVQEKIDIVKDIYVIAENMSTGDLQDDGTYRIDINTNSASGASYKLSIFSKMPLSEGDRLYFSETNKRYEIDRNGFIEIPTVEGDTVDLPRLYQRTETNISIETGNIKPSNVKLDYYDIN